MLRRTWTDRRTAWLAGAGLGLLLLGAGGRAAATEVATPPFFADAAELLERADDGQFRPLLEIHLTQYALRPSWSTRWAARRYAASGVLAAHGSISSRRLYVDRELALVTPAGAPLRLGYERREWQDGRFRLFDQRFHAAVTLTPAVALVAAGWPAQQKGDSALGGGLHLGRDGGPWLRALWLDERPFHERKSEDEVEFTRQPVRYLVDGGLGGDRLQLYGSLNLGEPYAARRAAAAPAGEAVTGSAALNHGTLGARFRLEPWTFDARGRFAAERLRQTGADSGALELQRRWGRLELAAERSWGEWAGGLTLTGSLQRDIFRVPELSGDYRMAQGVLGVSGSYRGWDPLSLRLGYLASWFGMDRRVDAVAGAQPATALEPREERGYADKVHLEAGWNLGQAVAVEAQISKEVSRSTFGGFSLKVLALF